MNRTFIATAFAAALFAAHQSTAAVLPSTGVYVLSGTVTTAVARNGALCETNGQAIQGYAYFPGPSNKGAFGVNVSPDNVVSNGIAYAFPRGFTLADGERGNMNYVLPPSTIPIQGAYSLHSVKTTDNSFNLTLMTTTESQDGVHHGSCTTTYQMNFQKGIPAKLKSLL